MNEGQSPLGGACVIPKYALSTIVNLQKCYSCNIKCYMFKIVLCFYFPQVCHIDIGLCTPFCFNVTTDGGAPSGGHVSDIERDEPASPLAVL